MNFEKRLAKIGKGYNVNLYLKNDENIQIFLHNNSCIEKQLNIAGERYNLETTSNVFPYDEVLKLSDKIMIVKRDNNIMVVNNNA